VATKDEHTKYTVRTIIVGNDDIDLTQSINPEVALITLRCGDINGDGEINQDDVNILWLPSNYNKRVSKDTDSRCDLNGDGEINQLDLNILWQLVNYNKGEVFIE
jgi:hypothetical protein